MGALDTVQKHSIPAGPPRQPGCDLVQNAIAAAAHAVLPHALLLAVPVERRACALVHRDVGPGRPRLADRRGDGVVETVDELHDELMLGVIDAEIARLLELGVDGLVTDFPERVAQVVAGRA